MNARPRFRHGLVLGKFYPPHAGHHHLVRTARARCDHLSVLVCAASVESIPLRVRVRWMAAEHPTAHVRGVVDDIPMDLGDPEVWDAHMEVFRGGLRHAPGPVDAVFTSEGYGDELARRFGAQHICVDQGRARHPVSGTAVRKDPTAHWSLLTGPVRAWLTRRVVVLGAECTGTTTLARALAAHYRDRGGVWADTRWVPEFGRDHSAYKLATLRRVRPAARWADVEFTSKDFPLIARRQNRRENRVARTGSPVLFCDTDAFATTIWHERYLGGAHPLVAELADRVTHHLWLLTDHEGVPFEDDGLRDSEHLRPGMTERFRDELQRTGRPFRFLTGSPEERLKTAVTAVDGLLAEGWNLADPLPERR